MFTINCSLKLLQFAWRICKTIITLVGIMFADDQQVSSWLNSMSPRHGIMAGNSSFYRYVKLNLEFSSCYWLRWLLLSLLLGDFYWIEDKNLEIVIPFVVVSCMTKWRFWSHMSSCLQLSTQHILFPPKFYFGYSK